jgi:hypothetical protein
MLVTSMIGVFRLGILKMADNENLKPKVLIAQSRGRVIFEIFRRILDAGNAGTTKEDDFLREQRRTQEEAKNKPQRQDNGRSSKPQINQTNYPILPTLPVPPGTQPIPEPPYQPPVNQPSPEPQPNPSPSTDVDPFKNPQLDEQIKRAERERVQKEQQERAQERRDQARRDQENQDRARKEQAEREESNRLRRDSDRNSDKIIEDIEKGIEESRRTRDRLWGDERFKPQPSTDRPFDGSGPLTFLNNSPFGGPSSRVLQTNSSPGEASLGDKLIKAIALSVGTGELKKEFLAGMQKLLTPESLAMMGGFLAVLGAGHIAAAAGGPIGLALAGVVDGAMLALAVGGNAAAVAEAAPLLYGFITKAYGAKTEADFLGAATDFAKFINVVGPNVVLTMTGAKAGKALGSISGKVASLGSDIGKLSPEKQKQVQNGLNAGRDLLSKLGKNIQDGFKGIFESISNALSHLPGNNPKKLTDNTASPNSGGKKPTNPPKPTKWTKATEDIEKSLQQRIDKKEPRISAANKAKEELKTALAALQAKKVNPEMVAKLTENGLFPNELNTLLNKARNPEGFAKGLDRIAKPKFDELMELANKFLIQASKQSKKLELDRAVLEVKDFIAHAVSDVQVYTFAKQIINSEKLSNVEKLSEVVKNFATQADRSASLGNQFEVEFAAKLVRFGSKIGIDKGADVVDYTKKHAWQLKNVDGKNSFGDRLKEAAVQLSGTKQEQVPLGYLKGIQLRITAKDSPEYRQSTEQLKESIKKAIGEGVKYKDKGKSNDKWNSVDQVQITIGNETHIFDIKKSREGIIFPSYRETEKLPPPSISELPTETRVAGLQNVSPQLLSAIEKYQQTVKNTPTPEQRQERQVAHQVSMSKQSDDFYRRLDQVNQNIQHLNTELAGQTFNLNKIPPNILRNASSNDPKAVAYASALLLKNSGRQAFISKESELELVKINDTGQVTLYSHLLSSDTKQNILDAAQQLQQEQTMQAQRSNSNQREM